jgi:tyrosyl-tRNA synthetase
MVNKVDLLGQLQRLGLLSQVSNESDLRLHLESGIRTVYCGFDPTADSLHVGNLVPLLALRRFQLAGHRPILLVGGATGMIGDPGGRSSERELKPVEEVRDYVAKIRQQASRYLDFDASQTGALVVDNADWTEQLNVIDYLRDIGKHFSVNAMIQKETVRRRLEDAASGISYTEFSYAILQSYDFVVLNRQFDCTIQMGGSDQWGNITSGIDLIRRMEGRQAHAITYPLITTADGTKFGKSMGNAIWLDAAKTSPYRFYQFWYNTADDYVIRYLKIFTFIDVEELERIAAAHQQDPGSRLAHGVLAREVTRLVHENEGVVGAERISQALFRNTLSDLAAGDLAQLAQDGLPRTEVEGGEVALVKVLVTSGLAVTPRGEVTEGQARKLVADNAVSVNGEKVSDPDFRLTRDGALFGRYYVVQKGKKNHHLVIFA